MIAKATVLCENYVDGKAGSIAEHGWAVYLEIDSFFVMLERL